MWEGGLGGDNILRAWRGYTDVDVEVMGDQLTEHQRRVVVEARESSIMYRLRRMAEALTSGERRTLLRTGGGGEGGDYQPVESSLEGLLKDRRRRAVVLLALASLGLFLLLILIVTLVGSSSSSRSSSGGGASVQRGGGPAPVHREYGCETLGKPPPGMRYIQIHNRCNQKLWPAILGQGGSTVAAPEGGWGFESGECKIISISSMFPSLRVWARTGCNEKFECVTGGCITNSLVDGFNVPLAITVVGGRFTPGVASEFNCRGPLIKPFPPENCPYELRVYGDQVPGTNVPLTSIEGHTIEVSPCFVTPLDPKCSRQVVGCRSICKGLDQGWVGYFINNAKGNPNLVNPWITLPSGKKVRWADQFLQGEDSCDENGCKMRPAWGAYRQEAYNTGGRTMKNLVCCDAGFACSPYQPNITPGSCSFPTACPTLGAGDPESKYHGKVKDLTWPQEDQDVRWSSQWPDWPMASNHMNYAKIYKDSSPTSYSWQFNDASSTMQCCGEVDGGPSYVLDFCPTG